MQKPLNLLYKIEPSLNLVYVVLFGRMEAADLLRFNDLVAQDPQRRLGMELIVDLTLLTEFDYGRESMQYQIELNRRVMAKGYQPERTAVIGRNDFDITFGKIIEMRAQVQVPVVMQVFMTLAEAVEWLDLVPAYDKIAAMQSELQRKATGLMGIGT